MSESRRGRVPTVPAALSSTAVAVLACLGSAHAAPDVAECKGAVVPSGEGCQGTTYAGCCDVFGRVFWCESGDLYCIDCAGQFPSCGWNPFGYYDCGQLAGSTDPSGLATGVCGGCPEACVEGTPCSAECAGSCGTCEEAGSVCLPEGSCYVPQCAGKECGSDPMGFSCGVCPSSTECVAGVFQCLALPEPCVPQAAPGCGIGCGCESCVCDKYPTCCTDSWDVFCATACELECGFDCSACPKVPTCDGIECGEYCGVSCGGCSGADKCVAYQCCTPSCDGKQCGSDGCGGSCGSCGAGDECAGGQCVPCQPKCGGKQCGDDGCGGICGECADGEFCLEGSCVTSPCFGSCGDDDTSCGAGCQCSCGESCFAFGNCCPGICDACGDFPGCCVPLCDGLECGDDGCGGACGACAAGSRCEAGACVVCEAPCTGKQCGDDGCGGTCGICGDGFKCENNQCVVCEAQCVGKECGDDGCEGTCGSCETGEICVAGICIGTGCTPSCDGKECGSDGCGSSCGTCPGASQCINFRCEGAADPCKGITTLGCCDGKVNVWCEGNGLNEKDCATEGRTCGWNDLYGYYDCTADPLEEPFGVFPRDCAALCLPHCGDRECGDDGCGGSCGTCSAGEACDDSVGTCSPAPAAELDPDASESDVSASADVAANEDRPSSGGCRVPAAHPSAPLGGALAYLLWLRRKNRIKTVGY